MRATTRPVRSVSKVCIQIAKSVLTVNSTCAHLIHKVGVFDDFSLAVKPAGDAFGTILAASIASKVIGLYLY